MDQASAVQAADARDVRSRAAIESQILLLGNKKGGILNNVLPPDPPSTQPLFVKKCDASRNQERQLAVPGATHG